MEEVSVFIGRFQPFHLGHLSVLHNLQTKKVYIGIGSSQYHHTLENPFTFDERKKMIHLALSKTDTFTYTVYPIPDIHDPPNWVEHVEHILPPFTQVLTNNDFTASLFEEKGYKVIESGLIHREQYRGAEIRKRMIHNQSWDHLVPSIVATYLHEIKAVERMQSLKK